MNADTDTLASPPPRGAFPRFLMAAVAAWLLWVLLTASLHPQELLAGAVVALVVAALSGPYLYLLDGVRLTPALPWHLGRFLAVFLLALVRANLDMAGRVLSPRLPIDPDVVTVDTELRSPLARLLLTSAITLTPGTLTVDAEDRHIHVHWVDVSPGTDRETATRAIAADFEALLKEFLL